MDIKVHGITLSAVNYKESDRILDIFTLEKGKITVSARGVRKATAKMKAIAEPFCFAESVLNEKSGRYTVKEIDVSDTFYPLRLDLKKYYAGLCALEFTNAFFPEETVSEDMFALLCDYLKKLTISHDEEVLLTEFFMRATEISGYALPFSACNNCGEKIQKRVFFSQSGSIVCENCRKNGDKEFSFSTYLYLKRVSENNAKDESIDDKKNGLKFFAYYITHVAGVTLKCLPPLINMQPEAAREH